MFGYCLLFLHRVWSVKSVGLSLGKTELNWALRISAFSLGESFSTSFLVQWSYIYRVGFSVFDEVPKFFFIVRVIFRFIIDPKCLISKANGEVIASSCIPFVSQAFWSHIP